MTKKELHDIYLGAAQIISSGENDFCCFAVGDSRHYHNNGGIKKELIIHRELARKIFTTLAPKKSYLKKMWGRYYSGRDSDPWWGGYSDQDVNERTLILLFAAQMARTGDLSEESVH